MLNLTGPQTLTIFAVNNAEFIPATAKQSSITAPQGYHCIDNDSLHLFITGQEYIYVANTTQDKQDVTVVTAEELGMSTSTLDRHLKALLKRINNFAQRLLLMLSL